jgi:uncharacterized membrane protein
MSGSFRKTLLKTLVVGGLAAAAYLIYLAATGQNSEVTEQQGIQEESAKKTPAGKMYYSDPEKEMEQEHINQE